MINHLLLICLIIPSYELIKFIDFKKILNHYLITIKKLIKLFKYKTVSDFRKEKLIFHCSKLLIFISFKILFIFFILLIYFYLLNLISESLSNLLISFLGFIETTFILIIYYIFRKKYERL